MKEDVIILVIVSIVLACASLMCSWQIYICQQRIEESQRLLARNEDVGKFRMDILRHDMNAYDRLPSYDEMLYSKKPLELKYWING